MNSGSVVLLSVFVILTALSAPVAAQGTSNTDWLCDDQGSQDFVNRIEAIIGVFMLMGPVLGVLVWMFATVSMTASLSDRGGTNYSQIRRDSILYGFSVPIAAWAFDLLAKVLFGFNISCVIPGA